MMIACLLAASALSAWVSFRLSQAFSRLFYDKKHDLRNFDLAMLAILGSVAAMFVFLGSVAGLMISLFGGSVHP